MQFYLILVVSILFYKTQFYRFKQLLHQVTIIKNLFFKLLVKNNNGDKKKTLLIKANCYKIDFNIGIKVLQVKKIKLNKTIFRKFNLSHGIKTFIKQKHMTS